MIKKDFGKKRHLSNPGMISHAKAKKILKKLPNEFLFENVSEELDKKSCLTKVNKSTVANYTTTFINYKMVSTKTIKNRKTLYIKNKPYRS